jgi:Asp/Glu/Hydantoin racemase
MLDTRFPRPPGDVGHPSTFRMPVRHHVVEGAFPRQVVASAASLRASGLHLKFVEAARMLERDGARAILTSCGFLVLLQQELQAAVRVPVVSSSLLQLPALLAQEPQVGVLTISAGHMTAEYLLAAGVPAARLADVLVQGVAPDSEFAGAILGNRPTMDLAQAGQDVVAAALALRSRAPELRTLVLECTNMPPYATAIAAATGWRLKSLLDAAPLLQWADA